MGVAIGIRTKDRWDSLGCLLATLLGQDISEVILVDQSVILPSFSVLALLRCFSNIRWVYHSPDPMRAQVVLFDLAKAHKYLLEIDDDIIPIGKSIVADFLAHMEAHDNCAFAMGCIQAIGHETPPDSPDEGYVNYLRFQEGTEPLSLNPDAIGSGFTMVRVSVIQQVNRLLAKSNVWKELVEWPTTYLTDMPYGVCAQALGYEAHVLPYVQAYHIRPPGGEGVRSQARGIVLDNLMKAEVRSLSHIWKGDSR